MPSKKVARNKHSLTFHALYYWGKILGVNPLNLSDSNELEFSYSSLFYAFLLVIIYSYIFYQTCVSRLKTALTFETSVEKFVSCAALISVFLQTSLTWFIFGLCQNRVIKIVKSFTNAERISRKLGIPENYEKYFRKIAIYLGIVSILHITFVIYCSVMLAHLSNVAMVVILFHMPRIASYNSLTIFVWSLMIVRDKFRRLNDTVRFLLQNYYARIRERDETVSSGLIRTSRLNSSFLAERIDHIFQLHRELRNVIHRIKEHFELFALLGISDSLFTLMLEIYHTGQILSASDSISGQDFWTFTNSCCRIVSVMIALAITSNICGTTSDEANETGNVLHAMLNDCENYGAPPEATKFNTFSLDLLGNKVKISLFDCLHLNHFLVFRVLITVVTYLVIMLQFTT